MSCTCHWCSTSWNGTSSCSSNSTTFVTGRSRIVQTSFGYQFSRFQCPESSEILYLHLKFLTFSRWCYFLVQRLYLGNRSCKSSSTFHWFCTYQQNIIKNSCPVTWNCIWFFIYHGSVNTPFKYSPTWIWSILLTRNNFQWWEGFYTIAPINKSTLMLSFSPRKLDICSKYCHCFSIAGVAISLLSTGISSFVYDDGNLIHFWY